MELVALNDSNGDDDALELDAVSGLVTVGLMADLFGVSQLRFARDVILVRLEENAADRPERTEAHGEICRTDPCARCSVRAAFAKAEG